MSFEKTVTIEAVGPVVVSTALTLRLRRGFQLAHLASQTPTP